MSTGFCTFWWCLSLGAIYLTGELGTGLLMIHLKALDVAVILVPKLLGYLLPTLTYDHLNEKNQAVLGVCPPPRSIDIGGSEGAETPSVFFVCS